MASKRFISPGVFTNEVDMSFLAQGVAAIGAVVVGRTPKGPAFLPVSTDGLPSFAAVFGNPHPDYPLTYAAKNYLKNAGTITTVRVLGHSDGTGVESGYAVGGITAIRDDDGGQALAVIHTSGAVSLTVVPEPNGTDFGISFVGSLAPAVTASFIKSAPNYIGKVLNSDPTKYDALGYYLHQAFSYSSGTVTGSWSTSSELASANSFKRDFSGASTSWIKSQPIGGNTSELFRVHTVSHGEAANNSIKLMIANVKPSAAPASTPYGTFDVVVRAFNDTDQGMNIVESFPSVTLDPDSPNFLPRRIGNHLEEFSTTHRKFVGSGEFPSKSSIIRIEMGDAAAPEALPFGFGGYAKESFSGSLIPDLPLTLELLDKAGNYNTNLCFGVNFVNGGVADRMKALPNASSSSFDADFNLDHLSSSIVNGRIQWKYETGSTGHDPIFNSASLYKFTLPFAGGFDGFDKRVANPLDLQNNALDTDLGVVSLKRAIDTIANPDAIDMNILAVPGVHAVKVTDKARQVVNDRGDALYIMDITGSSVDEAIQLLKAREIDDNYTAVYYPDLMLNDKTNVKVLRVSPSVAVLGAISFSDRVGQPWFAPAGMNRGGLNQFDIYDVVDRLNIDDRNDLYDNRINPIASFPREGIVVFGQKTLQVKASALDRVNVRRLLIYAKKTVASAAKLMLFDANNSSNWQRFSNTVNPIFERIRENNGVERFKVVMDTSTNTPDLIDRNIMTGKIFLQPTKAAEFISVDFIITAAGVEFGE